MAKVTVYTYEEDTKFEYDGDYDAGMAPNGGLVITENVPNVTGKGEATVPKMVAIYNKDYWTMVALDD